MLFFLVYVILFLIFLFAPLPFQIVFFVASVFIPDPIPVVDEALMLASIVKKINSGLNVLGVIFDFKEKHPILFRVIILSIVLLLAMIIIKLLS